MSFSTIAQISRWIPAMPAAHSIRKLEPRDRETVALQKSRLSLMSKGRQARQVRHGSRWHPKSRDKQLAPDLLST
jgi:hypothetical protein